MDISRVWGGAEGVSFNLLQPSNEFLIPVTIFRALQFSFDSLFIFQFSEEILQLIFSFLNFLITVILTSTSDKL